MDGKIIFLDPIDLSGKIIINDIIKINEGDIDLTHKRVDKLKVEDKEGTKSDSAVSISIALKKNLVKFCKE